MSARLARTADGWWVVTPAGLVRLDLPAATTAGLLADRTALTAAIEAAQATVTAAPQDAVPADSVDLLSPVTAPARVVAQAVNYRSHATDSGFDPATVPAAFFRKASHSITGPASDIIRPDAVGFLDYEVELGLVIGTDLPVGTTVTDGDLDGLSASLNPSAKQRSCAGKSSRRNTGPIPSHNPTSGKCHLYPPRRRRCSPEVRPGPQFQDGY